jgi:tetratricopeptide (TPR) repeat protein
MSPEHAPDVGTGSSLKAADERVTALRRALEAQSTPRLRAELIDALVELAGRRLAAGDESAAADALDEAEANSLSPPPDEASWQARAVMLHRARGGLAQRQGRHPEAVAAFEAALQAIPYPPGAGGRDANAARLQLLVRLGRSRLALGQAAETEAEARQCDVVMRALDGKIPARALDTVRAAVLDNHGAALAMLGETDAAKRKLAAGLELVDRLQVPELEDMRRAMLQSLAKARPARSSPQ